MDGHAYCCLTFDITEEVRNLFGVPVREAFVVLTKHDDMMEVIPKTIDTSDYTSPYGGFRFLASATSIDIPTMESIYAVFDDDHACISALCEICHSYGGACMAGWRAR